MWGRTEPCCSRRELACLRGCGRLRDTGRLTPAGSSPAARLPKLRAGKPSRRTPERRDDRRGLFAPEAVRTDRGTAASQPRGSAQTTSPAPAHRVRGRGPMPSGKLSQDLGRLDPAGPRYATDVVEHVLAQARAAEASDVYLHPSADGLEVRWRIDGVLQPVAVLPSRLAANVVARLKVLAELLTYRTDVPQEGRIRGAPGEVEMRLSTFPTLHGEKAVVRLFAGSGQFLRLADLGLPAEVHDALSQVLDETSGAGILSGPAGSGKTTSLYACLRELAARSRGERSLATKIPVIGRVWRYTSWAEFCHLLALLLESQRPGVDLRVGGRQPCLGVARAGRDQ